MVIVGPKVFSTAGEIMVKSLVITFICKNLNNLANAKYYAIVHCAWRVSNPGPNWMQFHAAMKEPITINKWPFYEL